MNVWIFKNKFFSYCLYVIFLMAFTEAAGAASRPFVNFQSLDGSLYFFDHNRVDPRRTFSTAVDAWGDYSIGDLYAYGTWQTALNNDYQGAKSSYYYKFIPRLSLGKNIDKDISWGIFKVTSLALWVSRTRGQGASYFPGLAMDWQLPGLDWFRTIYYFEHNDKKGWNDQRLHLDFGSVFSTDIGDFRIAGTYDMTFGQGRNPVMIDFKPELHYDLGKSLGYAPRHLWIGAVINPVKNKYKIQDTPAFRTNQFRYGFMVRYSFSIVK
ncbi:MULTISPECIES: hypothetical protein [Tenebrionibacter/Tenebrionicola group]|jgi:nucleoside-specific channel-forming protein|uniref:Nucleoside-specific outer membrane channel protein Tsx n=2 Tax=Tenebrionibacter/Tenebrionicola group TaxID=2969848 RepID=A0A8K0V015_9ENTR|nr:MULTISPECIES: hypothetical protein [Tenebrionibacter/Tenebrionicola group]MBK4714112.1 hypothetical protein [Tenebrionibacter intestinalis]MBV5094798.1 hypothetical protein [Tenebrionicola larvae]